MKKSIPNEDRSLDETDRLISELYLRLNLIEKIESSIENPQILQSLFKYGLWILNPKYDGIIRFTPYKTITTSNNSIICTYTSDHYLNDTAVIDGYDEIIIPELKTNHGKIKSREKYQLLDYAKEIRKKANHIAGYILADTIDSEEINPITDGNITIYPKQYHSLIDTARKRTLNRIKKHYYKNTTVEHNRQKQ